MHACPRVSSLKMLTWHKKDSYLDREVDFFWIHSLLFLCTTLFGMEDYAVLFASLSCLVLQQNGAFSCNKKCHLVYLFK